MKTKHKAPIIVVKYRRPNVISCKVRGQTVFEETFTDINANNPGRAEKAKLTVGTFHFPVF
jgi:hypothetical protein